MDATELAAIRERANAATPGPWLDGHNTAERHSGVTSIGDGYEGARIADVPSSAPDAVFIAHARTDIPNLLYHVDTLTARLEAVRELHTSLKPHGEGEHFLHPISRNPVCGECGQIAPCPTIQALDGD